MNNDDYFKFYFKGFVRGLALALLGMLLAMIPILSIVLLVRCDKESPTNITTAPFVVTTTEVR